MPDLPDDGDARTALFSRDVLDTMAPGPPPAAPPAPDAEGELDAKTMILGRDPAARAALLAELEDDEDEDSDAGILDAKTMVLTRDELLRRQAELRAEVQDEPKRVKWTPPKRGSD